MQCVIRVFALTGILATVLVLASPDRAAATLVGDDVTVFSSYGIDPNPPFSVLTATDTVIVGAGVELFGDGTNDHSDDGNLSFLFPNDSIDIGASSFAFFFNPFNLQFAFITQFLDLEWTGASPGVVQSATLIDPNNVVIAGAQVNVINAGTGVEFQGTVDLTTGAAFSIDLTVVHTPVADVPGPAALPIFASGLVGLFYLRRRRGLLARAR